MNDTDAVQRMIVRLVATSPAGHNLLLIGGFRYRFLDQSVRTSKDIDYHWAGDPGEKQRELLSLFRKRLLPSLRREFGYVGRADAETGPDAESPAVRTVLLAFWKPDVESSRIEIPVEITRVVCLDRAEIRTMDGVVYSTLSDADLIESKIAAIFSRRTIEHRDLVDIFLFGNKLVSESPERLRQKLKTLGVSAEDIARRLDDLKAHAAYHAKAIQAIIDTQLDAEAAKNIHSAGGASWLLAKAREALEACARVQ